MKHLVLRLLLALVWLLPAGVGAMPALQYQGAISSPRANAVLRGQVVVEGTANHPDFWKYEVRVTPGLNPNVRDDQWFRVLVREQAVNNGQLAVWDTTTVPDGVYTLRLRVVRRDGNWQDFDVLPLNVGNTVQPTAVPAPPTATPEPPPTPEEASTPTPDSAASPTPVNQSSTPDAAATLPPSGGTPNPAATLGATEPLTPTTPGGTATPILIDQPTIIVATPSEVAVAGSEEVVTTPVVATQPSSDLPSLPVDLGGELALTSLTSACFTGIAFTGGIFLLVGLLFLLKSLLRLFR